MMFKNIIKENLVMAEDFFFNPHCCICCGGECDLDNEYRLCSQCVNRLDFINDNFCLKCGEKIGSGYDYCLTCKEKSFDFDYARAVVCYNDCSAPMILKFKYNGQAWYKTPLSHFLFDYYKDSDIIADCVTYVPMPENREKERGYNQSRLLAEEFSKLSNLPLLDLLTRKEETIKQATLSAEERRKNIIGSFLLIDKQLIKGRDILLIDDVSTTGATANECAKILKKGKARSVIVLTIAKTSREKSLIK